MKLVQINVAANVGSTGKIAEQIGLLAKKYFDWESYIAYGRFSNNSQLKNIKIGSGFDIKLHGLSTRVFDNHGLESKKNTKTFISRLNEIKPNIVHLHNIHGYYLHYPILFEWLKKWGGPVVWTLHDCWPFTGHCAYFMMSGCEKWKTECHKCESLRAYPASFFRDRSSKNFAQKKEYFTSLGDKLTLVPVSNYVGNYLKDSFFEDTRMQVIHNGINLDVFKPCAPKEKYVLGVANVWEPRKGLTDFFKLRDVLPSDFRIILVGLSDKQLKNLPAGIEGIKRTNGQAELAKLYSSATALINPTYEDNYPTVNLEAIACGTPVITYNTGGSPESISDETGIVLPQRDIQGILNGINRADSGEFSIDKCRKYAEENFDQQICYKSYLNLYKSLLG